ncbi:MAG: acyl-ACP--UDP-N-acetylglucosamine O-acyltransferase [Flavobacteriales bacterium]|nr:acyl-ACP--UDP-N-acetylglucosamine O-acyltransferase [Flavobacteriales bacterium]
MTTKISPQAFIHEQASLGEGVIVEPFSYIGPNVTIGPGTYIGPNVSILESTTIGEDCKIFPGAVIGAEPQDLKFKDENTTVEIGNRTTIRECVTIHRGTSDKLKTTVGNDCLIMAYVHLAHDVQIGDSVILANAVNVAGHVTIDDWVIIEGMVGIQQFIRIGEHAFVAGGSLVRKNIPPYIKAAREPLSYIGVNSIGLRRRGFDQDRITRIEDIYRTLYVQNANMSQALKVADAEFPACEDKDFVLDFIRKSDKGIIRGPF